mgnify:CR=1 FL=1
MQRTSHLLRAILLGQALVFGAPAIAFAASPLAQEYTVAFHNQDSEYYIAGVGFERLEDGTLVGVVPVIPRPAWVQERRATHSRTNIVTSRDGGKTWQLQSTLPYFSAVPWIHEGKLHLFAHKGGSETPARDVLLLRSADAGRTWTREMLLYPGQFWNTHTAVIVRGNRIYYAMDDFAAGPNRGLRVLAGDLSMNLLDRGAWRLSEPLVFPGLPESLVPPGRSGGTRLFSEANVIEINGRLRLLASVNAEAQATTGLSAVIDVADERGELTLSFSQFHPAPGAQVKRAIIRDERSKLFWATANLAVDGQEMFGWWEKVRAAGAFVGSGGNDRRFLMLLYSVDGLNWFQAGCIAQAAKLSQSFMYARPVIDGDDLAILVRSSVNAPNQHDADYATFHRVKNFRKLALDLYPSPER